MPTAAELSRRYRGRLLHRRSQNPVMNQKKAVGQRKIIARSMMSLFKRGLRRLQVCLQRIIPPPPLWVAWKSDGW